MKNSSRIELTDTVMDMLIKLAEGNPGALTALMKLSETSEKIDPDSFFGPLSPLLSLDTHGIYGPRIWVLWKDVCGMDPIKVQTLLRAVQLGFMSESELKRASDSSAFDFQAINDKVRETLPAFAAIKAEPPA